MKVELISKFLCCPRCFQNAEIHLVKSRIFCKKCGEVGTFEGGVLDFIGFTDGKPKYVETDLYSKYWSMKKPDVHQSKESVVERELFSHLSYQKPFDSLADIGCGDGRNVRLFLDHNVKTLVLIDYSDHIYSLARSMRDLDAKTDFIFIRCSAEALPIRDNSISLVWCSGLINFFVKPHIILSELARTSSSRLIIGSTSLNVWGRFYEWLNPVRAIIKIKPISFLLSVILYSLAFLFYFPLSRLKAKLSATNEKSATSIWAEINSLYFAMLEIIHAGRIFRVPLKEMDRYLISKNFVFQYDKENFLIDIRVYAKRP